jgi:hypothetical protein
MHCLFSFQYMERYTATKKKFGAWSISSVLQGTCDTVVSQKPCRESKMSVQTLCDCRSRSHWQVHVPQFVDILLLSRCSVMVEVGLWYSCAQPSQEAPVFMEHAVAAVCSSKRTDIDLTKLLRIMFFCIARAWKYSSLSKLKEKWKSAAGLSF